MSPWLLATGDFTTLGGMDRANHALAAYLARAGHSVQLVAHRVADDLSGAPNVRVERVARPFGSHLAGAPLLARAAARAARAARADGPARILMNGGNGAIGTATWIHYLHAAYSPEPAGPTRARLSLALGRRYYLARERAAVRAAPLVICNSERTLRDVQAHYGVPAARLRVVYYGADAGTFSPVSPDVRRSARVALGVADGRLAAAFVGALGDRRKGFDLLFGAWRELASDPAWDVDLLVAGAGAEAADWTARARAAGIGDSVRLLGFRTDVETVLAASDVLVHPARYEAYGLGVHEAVCRGVPAIVTSSAGVAERLPGTLGGLVLGDPPRIDGLVTVVRAWRARADEWRARAACAGGALRSRSWDDMAAEIAAAVDAAA